MKLKILTAVGITGLLFTSCVSEFKNDVNLHVNVTTEEDVSFDGQTITVKAGTPVNFQLSGEADFLTFFSGEAGHEYRYKDRITVDESEIASSELQLSIFPQYGQGSVQLYVSDTFTGLYGSGSTSRNLYLQDSVLVESTDWQPLMEKTVFGGENANITSEVTPFIINMKPYLGKRIAIAIYYEGGDAYETVAQTRFTFQNMQLVNTMNNGQQTALTASSFGFTAVNMLYFHPDFLGTDAIGTRRRTAVGNKPYGTATNNTEGCWNVTNWDAFFIHSTGAGRPPQVHSWIVSNLLVVNACSSDSGMAVKNITESMSDYSYTYTEPGTYTATFYAANFNNITESNITREYTVVVIE